MTRSFARARISALLAVICGTSAPALSQERESALVTAAQASAPEGRPVTLAQVIERAQTNPPAPLAALATLERFQAQEHLARGAYLPKLSFGGQAGALYNNYPYLVSRSNAPPLPLDRLSPNL